MNLSEVFQEWILADWILTSVFSTLVIATLAFLVFFLIPSLKLWLKLRRVISALTQLKSNAEKTHQMVDPAVVGRNVMQAEPLRHLWAEYSETLHAQFDEQNQLLARRATVPAEVFFNTEVLVTTALRTEFFKHLPGIFTGIGIIGTFYGLITGLSAFHPSEDPTIARQSLEALKDKVGQAFQVSAAAITLAMIVTFLERITVTQRYKQVEQLCHLIDSMYTSGVGEEYLARLVRASEENATQTTQLKDSLVADLKEMMTNLVDRQINATEISHKMLAANITESIMTSMRGPMETLSRVVEKASQHQGENVQQALSDVIAGFMAKLEDTFGGQLNGLNVLMQETTASMRETRDRFAELVNSLSTAGRSAGEAMTEQLTRAMEQAEQRQRDMNNQMREFVEQIRDLVAHSQNATSANLHAVLDSIGQKMTQVMDNLSTQQSMMEEETLRRQQSIAGQAQTAMSDLGTQVTALTAQTSQAILAMKESITAIRNITADSVEKMNGAAETLYVAASDFSKAGTGVSGVFERASQVAEKLSSTATSLDAAAKTVQSAVSAYDKTRSELTGTIEILRGIIDSAKRDATVSRELVAQLEAAADKFNIVQKQTETYLDNVSGVLTRTFEDFSGSMKKSLSHARSEFDLSLANAVEMLRSTIDGLEEYLSQLPQKR